METEPKQEPSDIVKVVLYGPESTGKTTLAKKLAEHYRTVWVPEFARDYLQQKWDKEKKICEIQDILPIVKGQLALENELTKKANKLLVCDTDPLTTKVYSEAYYNGECPDPLTKVALNNIYDLYFLTYIDIPWVADDLRDRPLQREEMFFKFKAALDEFKKPYLILEGDIEERLKKATSRIDEILKIKKIGI